MKRQTNREIRHNMARNVLPSIRKLVLKFDLPAVQHAVKILYDERAAAKELKKAEQKVLDLKKKLSA